MEQKSKIKTSTDEQLAKNLIVPPLQGSGPGLLLIDRGERHRHLEKSTQVFSEEGYCVLAALIPQDMEPEALVGFISKQVESLKNHPKQAGKIGAIFFDSSATQLILNCKDIKFECAVSYGDLDILSLEIQAVKSNSIICHQVIESDLEKSPKSFLYSDCKERFFDSESKNFNKSAASMAYSRTLELLKSNLGPIYDIQELWEKHTMFEFSERDVDKTMETMVAEPYVNHIPTMTGGVGYKNLHDFYTNYFVNSNPPDTKLIPVSRTVGVDRLVDEMIFCFTHSCEIPWMLPNVKPTGNYVEIPLVAIVNFRGKKLYHEHIYWDQASVLVQIGKLDSSMLPIVGIETAKKLIDETLPSNELMMK